MKLVQIFPAIRPAFQAVKTAEIWQHHKGYDVLCLDKNKFLAAFLEDVATFKEACDLASDYVEEK